MDGKIVFLKDSEINDWLIFEFKKKNIDVDFFGINNSSQKLNSFRVIRILYLHSRYIILSFKGVFKSEKKDVIICYLDVLGMYVFLLSKITFRKRKIIVINLMFNNHNNFITKIKKYLFRLMLKDVNIYPTVTSRSLSNVYNEVFKLREKVFYLVQDC